MQLQGQEYKPQDQHPLNLDRGLVCIGQYGKRLAQGNLVRVGPLGLQQAAGLLVTLQEGLTLLLLCQLLPARPKRLS